MYLPSEDSFFMQEELTRYLKKKNKEIRILDMGTGSGIQAETCLKLGFKNVTACDIDKEAVEFARKKGIEVIRSNLFSNLKNGKFDLIIFNPPYLPEDRHDKEKDTSGGKKGDEASLRFLKQAKSHLTREGEILLLLSSHTSRERINKIIGKNYKQRKLSEKKLFFEKLEILALANFV